MGAHARRGEAPLRPPEGGKLSSPAADPWSAASDPGDRGADRKRLGSRAPLLFITPRCGSACDGSETKPGKLSSFSFQYQRFPLGPRSGPVFWNGCPFAQLQGGVPNLGGLASLFPALLAASIEDRPAARTLTTSH